MKDIVEHVSVECPGVCEVVRSSVAKNESGVEISVAVIFDMDNSLRENIESLQRRLAEEVANMTAFNILTVNVTVKGLRPVEGL